MFTLRTLKKQVSNVKEKIREKKKELTLLEANLISLQQTCNHEQTINVESIQSNEGWLFCENCEAAVVRIY
jgi:hypothetical protein